MKPWWVCDCGRKIAPKGKGVMKAWRKHRQETGCYQGGRLKNLP